MDAGTTARIDPGARPAGDWQEPFGDFLYLDNGYPLRVVRHTEAEEVAEAIAEHTGGAGAEEIWGAPADEVVFICDPSGEPYGMGRSMSGAIEDANECFRSGEYTLGELQLAHQDG